MTSPPSSDGEGASLMWMIIAMAVTVVAILLAITSIALATALCYTKKNVKSESASKLTPQEGTKKHVKSKSALRLTPQEGTKDYPYTHKHTNTHTQTHEDACVKYGGILLYKEPFKGIG